MASYLFSSCALGINQHHLWYEFLNSHDHINLIVMNNEVLFFNHFDGPYFPTLKLIHKCKEISSCRSKPQGGQDQPTWRLTSFFFFFFYLLRFRLNLLDPNMLPRLQVDRGAIKFVMAGANIMCPGLTSKGAKMDVSVPADAVVAITAEGKHEILAVGTTKMSTDDM